MKHLSKFRALFYVVVGGLTLVYWPTACAGGSAAPPGAPPSAAASDQLLSPAKSDEGSSARNWLPHPAFAYASQDPSAPSIADIAEKATPSVVSITSEREVEGASMNGHFPFFPFFGPQQPQGPRKQQGAGSGVIVSSDGIVLTNHHVVEKATEITVKTTDDREFEVEVIGSDAKSDLAVLRLKGDVAGLTPLEIGDSSNLRLGDVVLAIGNPFAVGQTVTMGIVSAKGRADVGIVDYEDFIQTDAAINPGNSGGALVNMRGELVGINTAILSRSGGYQGIGFAIPTKMAKPIMSSLIEHGRVVRGFLGIGIQDVDPSLAKAMGLPDAHGVLVTEVQSGSAAEKAGLKQRDIVLSVDGEKVDSTGKLRNLIAGKGTATVSLVISRGGKQQTVSVALAELPDDQKAGDKKPNATEPTLGMTLAPLDDRMAQRLDLPKGTPGSVVVSGVDPGSQAAEAGIRPGDILLELNRKPIKDVATANKLLRSTKGSIVALVRRGPGNRYVLLRE